MQAPEANRNWKEDGKEKKNGSGVGSDKEEGGKEKIANRQRAIPTHRDKAYQCRRYFESNCIMDALGKFGIGLWR